MSPYINMPSRYFIFLSFWFFKPPAGVGETFSPYWLVTLIHKSWEWMKCLNKMKTCTCSTYRFTNTLYRHQTDQVPYYIVTLGKSNFQKCSLLILGHPVGLLILCITFSPDCLSLSSFLLWEPKELREWAYECCVYPHFLVLLLLLEDFESAAKRNTRIQGVRVCFPGIQNL